MKVIRNTPALLIVENTPWMFAILVGVSAMTAFSTSFVLLYSGSIFGGILVGLVSTAIFPLAIYFIVQRVQVVFDTAKNTMSIRTRTFSGYTSITHDLRHLSHADLDTHTNSKDNSRTHCAIFVLKGGMSTGKHQMTATYQSGDGASRIVDTVNEWLKTARSAGHLPSAVDSDTPAA